MILEVRNAYCGYSKESSVLNNINFTVSTGEVCCLLGPNGVGKTTLFKSILGLLRLKGGEVNIDGENIRSWSIKKIAKTIAYVPQAHTPPFPYKVKDVVLLGRTSQMGYFGQPFKADYEIANEAMKDMGIEHLRDKEYTDISGGERQLVLIARALTQEPDFLVLDEPTENLDFGNAVKVIKEVNKLKEKGLGVIMTTHSPDQVFQCDCNVVLLQRNNPLIFGTANEVVNESNLKSAYGVDVKILEYFDDNGNFRKVCTPVM